MKFLNNSGGQAFLAVLVLGLLVVVLAPTQFVKNIPINIPLVQENINQSNSPNPSASSKPGGPCDPDPFPVTVSLPTYQFFNHHGGKNGGWDKVTFDGPPTTYVRVRKNVLLSESFFKPDTNSPGGYVIHTVQHGNVAVNASEGNINYEIWPVGNDEGFGEVDSKNLQSSFLIRPNEGPVKKIYFIDYKIVILVRSPLQRQQVTKNSQTDWYWLADLYQPQGEQQLPADELVCSLGGQGSTKTETTTTTNKLPPEYKVDSPNQAISPDKKELQLEYFIFKGVQKTVTTTNTTTTTTFTAGDVYSTHCKPAIYLYPETETAFNVKVNTKGVLAYTDPKYPLGGWNGVAYPGGRIVVSGRDYPYLYYESKIPDQLIEKPKDGLTVSYNQLASTFDLLMPKLGLNSTQVKDFKEYWLKALPYSPYYFIGAISEENINSFEPLDITPKPDYNNRVRIYFEALSKKLSFEARDNNDSAPSLNYLSEILRPNLDNKSGFRMVEWGGMVKRDPLHNFTCSE